MASTGSIVVSRDKAPWRDRGRKYKLLVDGTVVGRLTQGDTVTHQVEPGPHSVQVKIDWARSPEIQCSVASGQSAQLVCGPGGSSMRVDALFHPGKYVRLEQIG
jgi:hypothetical protein